jgi:hypothetical protein
MSFPKSEIGFSPRNACVHRVIPAKVSHFCRHFIPPFASPLKSREIPFRAAKPTIPTVVNPLRVLFCSGVKFGSWSKTLPITPLIPPVVKLSPRSS